MNLKLSALFSGNLNFKSQMPQRSPSMWTALSLVISHLRIHLCWGGSYFTFLLLLASESSINKLNAFPVLGQLTSTPCKS